MLEVSRTYISIKSSGASHIDDDEHVLTLGHFPVI